MNILTNIDKNPILDALSMGEIDALLVKIWIKNVESQLEEIKELADEMAYNEALKYGEKTFVKDGYKIDVVEYLKPEYNYAASNHPLWNKWKEKAEEAAKELKSIQATLLTVKQPFEMVDEETGEMVKVVPPTKSGKSGLKLTKVKQ